MSTTLTEIEVQEAAHRLIGAMRNRFDTPEEASNWLHSGTVPGYGSKSPLDLVREGNEEWIYEALAAIDAGVYA